MTDKPTVVLGDGNAFVILGACRKAAKRAGWDSQKIENFVADATSGSYEYLLAAVGKNFNVRVE